MKKDRLDANQLRDMYEYMEQFQNNLHEQNKKRIKKGLLCLWIVPAIFLFLLFVSGSSKLVFLVFWIISLFILAVYLLTVEYLDYTVQQKWSEVSGKQGEDPDSLIELPRVEQTAEKLLERWDEKEGM